MAELDIAGILETVLESVSIVRNGPVPLPGEALKLAITPKALDIKVPVLVDGKLDLTWLAKNVRFSDPLSVSESDGPIENYLAKDTEVIGGQPIANVIVQLLGPALKGALPPLEIVNIGITTIGGTPPTATAVTPTPVANSLDVDLPIANPPDVAPKDMLSGVPGLLGQVSAKIPFPVLAPVAINVEWRVEHAIFGTGDFPTNPTWESISPEIGADGTRDYLAPLGLRGPSVELVLPPSFIDFKTSVSLSLDELEKSMAHYRVIARVTVSALSISAGPVELTIPVDVPAIGIPRVAAFFRNINFDPHFDEDDGEPTDGAALLLVPNSFPVQAYEEIAPFLTQLASTLTQLQTTLRDTKAGLKLAGFLLGLNSLISALDTQPMFQFRVADKIDHLSTVVFRNGGWKVLPPAIYQEKTANNRISSMIFLGVDGSKIELFNDTHLSRRQGAFRLTTGIEMWAAIRDLRFRLADEAVVIPVVIPKNNQLKILFAGPTTNFQDNMESLQFA